MTLLCVLQAMTQTETFLVSSLVSSWVQQGFLGTSLSLHSFFDPTQWAFRCVEETLCVCSLFTFAGDFVVSWARTTQHV